MSGNTDHENSHPQLTSPNIQVLGSSPFTNYCDIPSQLSQGPQVPFSSSTAALAIGTSSSSLEITAQPLPTWLHVHAASSAILPLFGLRVSTGALENDGLVLNTTREHRRTVQGVCKVSKVTSLYTGLVRLHST